MKRKQRKIIELFSAVFFALGLSFLILAFHNIDLYVNNVNHYGNNDFIDVSYGGSKQRGIELYLSGTFLGFIGCMLFIISWTLLGASKI